MSEAGFVHSHVPFLLSLYFTKRLRSYISSPVTLPATAGFGSDLAQGSAGDQAHTVPGEMPSLLQLLQTGCHRSSNPAEGSICEEKHLSFPSQFFHLIIQGLHMRDEGHRTQDRKRKKG